MSKLHHKRLNLNTILRMKDAESVIYRDTKKIKLC